MRIKIFDFDMSNMIAGPSGTEEIFKVPSLPAYAINYAIFYAGVLGVPVDNNPASIRGDEVVWRNDLPNSYSLTGLESCRLEIHYHGIREYNLLFPKVLATEPDRANRLGLYYQELETCFDNGAWLSFMLMAGAIFEHLLYVSTNGAATSLKDLNDKAKNRGLLSNDGYLIVDKTRQYRNVIHCNRMHESYVERKDAMDARTLIEKLILTI